jgi:hypothetical protein
MSDWLIWTAFLFAVLIVFAVLETRALLRPGGITLSRYTATIGAKFPMSIFLAGLIVGGLAVHFWWHWGCDISLQGG